MGILSNIYDRTVSVNSSAWRRDGAYFFGMGAGGSDLLVTGGNAWYFNAYKNCPPISSIVNKKCEAFVNGENFVTATSGQNKGKESESAAAKKIKELFKKPNPLQSWSNFEAQLLAYYQIYGYAICLPILPVGFNDPIDTGRLWLIPPDMVDMEESRKIWYVNDGKQIVKKIILRLDEETTEIKWEDLLIFSDFMPSDCSLVLPESRLAAIRYPIDTVMQGYVSAKNGLKNTPLGIIGNDTKDSVSYVPLDPEEKARIENELDKKGLGDNQRKFIISNANLNWMPISYPLASLQIPENIKLATEAICDQMNYPFELLSNAKGVTFSNKRDAMKLLYQDIIIPMAKSIYEQWNNYFQTGRFNIVIEKGYDHLPVLQEDAQAKATARKTANEAYKIEFENDLITVNRWLELNGEDTRADGDVYYSQWIKMNPAIVETKKGKANA